MNITFISLGCAKNLVDSEYILGLLRQDQNIKIIDSIEDSNAIFINTCGFIESAKKEAIDTIFSVVSNKPKDAYLIVVGCLAQRYKKQLSELIPEIDLIVSIDEYGNIGTLLNDLFHTKFPKTFDMLKRSLTNPLPVAYLKIGEGCSNRCAYCAIPIIRHDYYSYPKETILEDAKRLIKLGKKEIIVIAQDPTRYGKDLYDDYGIEKLMEDLAKLDNSVYFRVLYLYPDRISGKLIQVFKENDNIINYFDIPIQHSSDRMLKKMKRSGTKKKYLTVINKIKNEIPGAILRTTLITGFPGETIEDFNDLLDFIKLVRFDHLGVFAFSDEEDTKAHYMKNKIDIKTATNREKKAMAIQRKISKELNENRIGQIHKVLIEDYNGTYYIGRSYLYAHDADDGCIYVQSDKELIIGEFVNVEIIKALDYDLIAKVLDGETNGLYLQN